MRLREMRFELDGVDGPGSVGVHSGLVGHREDRPGVVRLRVDIAGRLGH